MYLNNSGSSLLSLLLFCNIRWFGKRGFESVYIKNYINEIIKKTIKLTLRSVVKRYKYLHKEEIVTILQNSIPKFSIKELLINKCSFSFVEMFRNKYKYKLLHAEELNRGIGSANWRKTTTMSPIYI